MSRRRRKRRRRINEEEEDDDDDNEDANEECDDDDDVSPTVHGGPTMTSGIRYSMYCTRRPTLSLGSHAESTQVTLQSDMTHPAGYIANRHEDTPSSSFFFFLFYPKSTQVTLQSDMMTHPFHLCFAQK